MQSMGPNSLPVVLTCHPVKTFGSIRNKNKADPEVPRLWKSQMMQDWKTACSHKWCKPDSKDSARLKLSGLKRLLNASQYFDCPCVTTGMSLFLVPWLQHCWRPCWVRAAGLVQFLGRTEKDCKSWWRPSVSELQPVIVVQLSIWDPLARQHTELYEQLRVQFGLLRFSPTRIQV